MFKEQYIRDNDKLKAKETLLMEIKEKNTREKIAFTPRQKFVRYGAVFAAFVLVAAGVFGVTQLGKGTSATPANVTLSAAADSSDIREVKSYDDIYGLIETLQNNNVVYGSGVMMESAAIDGAATAPAPAGAAEAKADTVAQAPATSTSGTDFSETNVQVKGVDEADIVKTDGNFIYYISGNQLNIIKPDGASTKLISSTRLSSDDTWWGYNSEMFLLGNRLMIITQSYNTVWVNDANGNYQTNTDQTSAIIFDITNPAKPAQVVSLGQSGNYVSSRMIGDYVYLVTSQYIYSPVKGTPITYIPSTTDGKESKLLQPTDLYVGGNPQNAAYTVIGSINLKSGANFTSAKAVFGGTSTLYATADHLLLAFGRYDSETQPIAPDKDGKNVQITRSASSTNLVLLGLSEGQITKLASGSVPGSLLNQFAMDEYQNVIRIVTTVDNWEQRIYTDGIDTYENDNTSANALYTLDLNLKVLGKIENLAKDEYVKSVRFDGDIGYFVTFRQVDPLFAVDLSNAASPRILDALKIPVSYTHLRRRRCVR